VNRRPSKCRNVLIDHGRLYDPGDSQGGKRTSITHDQYDPSKEKAVEGKDGTNLKEIGIDNDRNDDMLISDDEAEDKEDAEDQKNDKRRDGTSQG